MENLEAEIEYKVRCPCFKILLPLFTGLLFLFALASVVLVYLGAEFKDGKYNFVITLAEARLMAKSWWIGVFIGYFVLDSFLMWALGT